MDEDEEYGLRYKYHAKMYKILNKPYEWWGTYYTIDMEAWKKELDQIKKNVSGQNWDDYDEDGIAYWEKWEDEGGPVKDTEERLKYMEDNGI
jgi:hypothetical protein